MNPNLPNLPHSQIQKLQDQINAIERELQEVVDRTLGFEKLIVAKLEDQIILEQELSLLYKQQKQAKKEQRKNQKQRGKNYSPTSTLSLTTKEPTPLRNKEEQQQKKRLYREAMLFVHPDKFSTQRDKLELATEITTQLIQIYEEGDLATLQAYHAHVFSGNTLLPSTPQPEKITGSGLDFLKMELARLQEALHLAKNKHTFKVLTEYKEPMDFLEELKAYYKDRISKLRRRTRTKK
ncbi:hypothetical protein [Arenibacter certesii]|uniref:J domain-containing protein n=1 Tax=Arenibacter certesii TaxID=228955 RepID=A0A918MJG7_9FLAO|nr:hypothetical protein [Arenibacter certesii]GGW27856.1 hypothetical protein GCM10007383_11670 [Arenibacter certesii]